MNPISPGVSSHYIDGLEQDLVTIAGTEPETSFAGTLLSF